MTSLRVTVPGVSIEAERTLRIEEGATYTYIGKASVGASESGAVWQIKRITNATGDTLFADGDALADNVWDSRASLSYT